jgi:hypothetical protein
MIKYIRTKIVDSLGAEHREERMVNSSGPR